MWHIFVCPLQNLFNVFTVMEEPMCKGLDQMLHLSRHQNKCMDSPFVFMTVP